MSLSLRLVFGILLCLAAGIIGYFIAYAAGQLFREGLFQFMTSFSLPWYAIVGVQAGVSAGLPIVEFAWSRKERDSLITKLLAKRDSIAADVYDKLRFRLITRRLEDLPAVLRELLCRLIPFNYIIPGQAVNRLLPFQRIIDDSPSLRRHLEHLQPESELNIGEQSPNHFSSDQYRVINFVADLPLRVGTMLPRTASKCDSDDIDPRGVVYVLTEFQVMDAQTAIKNEEGESSHAVYKERQHIEVKARLTRGSKSKKNGSGGPREP